MLHAAAGQVAALALVRVQAGTAADLLGPAAAHVQVAAAVPQVAVAQVAADVALVAAEAAEVALVAADAQGQIDAHQSARVVVVATAKNFSR